MVYISLKFEVANDSIIHALKWQTEIRFEEPSRQMRKTIKGEVARNYITIIYHYYKQQPTETNFRDKFQKTNTSGPKSETTKGHTDTKRNSH